MKRIILLAALTTSSFFYAQVRVGVESNNQYYLDDDKIKIDETEAEERFRSNTYIKLDYFKNKWEFGTQIESYYPKAIINYSPDLKDVNIRSEEHTSELQSRPHLVCRLLLEK